MKINLSIEDKEFLKDVKIFAKKRAPEIMGKALNKMAFAATQQAKVNSGRNFINRNNFTKRSIQFEKVDTFTLGKQQSIVGSTAHYMQDQEFGGRETAKGGGHVPIPTQDARIGKTRNKSVRKPFYKNNLNTYKTGRRTIPAIINSARAKGVGNVVYLPLRKSAGLYRVAGRKTKPTIRMIYALNKKSVTNGANPWLYPATNSVDGEALFLEAARHTIKTKGLT